MAPPADQRRCPICARAFDPHLTPAMPFCSVRCRQIDLHRWLGEKYALPGEPPDEESPPDAPDDGG